MQVRKFEAPTMKEALELVKTQLGPDAIILSAKDNKKSFGLVGRGSVEVTAAVSELQIRKKQIAESKINEKDRERLKSSRAKVQKDFIEKSINRAAAVAPPSNRGNTSLRYVDIKDENENDEAFQFVEETVDPIKLRQGKRVTDVLENLKNGRNQFVEEDVGLSRVKAAAKSALAAGIETFKEASPTRKAQPLTHPQSIESQAQVLGLKAEIKQLKEVIQAFRAHQSNPLSLHPGAQFGIPYELSFMFEKLTSAGINERATAEILELAKKSLTPQQIQKRPLVDAWVVKYIMGQIEISQRPYDGRLHLFVGAPGQGKTATLVKLASHLVIRERRNVAIISADTSKVGSVDQLRIYSQILNVPFGVIRTRSDWDSLFTQLSAYDSILVDFPGLSLKSNEEIDFYRQLMPPDSVQRSVHYVQTVTSKDEHAFEMARRYKAHGFQDVVFTYLDESVHHGLIYSFQKEFKTPLHSFGIGPLIPEDFELATRERVIDLIFKITKIRPSERG